MSAGMVVDGYRVPEQVTTAPATNDQQALESTEGLLVESWIDLLADEQCSSCRLRGLSICVCAEAF
jgi:hypothetical protein